MTLSVNNFYNFSLHTNPVLGITYLNARLVGVLDYQSALKLSNVVLLHRQIYPYLPAGTVEDQSKYTYYHFIVGGKSVVLADVWLIDSSVELSTGSIYTVRLMNITTAQAAVIRDQLRLLGVVFSME